MSVLMSDSKSCRKPKLTPSCTRLLKLSHPHIALLTSSSKKYLSKLILPWELRVLNGSFPHEV